MSTLADLDLPNLESWIGRHEEARDVVTPGLAERFSATFGDWVLQAEGAVPPGLHWCLAPPAVPEGQLGPDGHPKRGGFLPPVPFPNRMWAGGEITFLSPIRIGDEVTRSSRIENFAAKEGRSGPLVFVSVRHVLTIGASRVIEERQDIVYRPDARGETPKGAGGECAPGPDDFVAGPVMLFRYSAMSFNGHRIHYDHPYVTGTEGYAGLVVHGPIQATLLINAAARDLGTEGLTVTYRGRAPLIAEQPAQIHRDEGRYWLQKRDGTATFEAHATRES